MALDCKVCHDIWRLFMEPGVPHQVNFGSFKHVLSSNCSTHAPLVKAFANHCLDGLHSRIRESDDIGIERDGLDSSVGMTESLSKGGSCWDLLLAQKDSIPRHPGIGRIMDPDWVDIEIVKKWKYKCLTSHGSKCKNPMRICPTRPAWLVDVVGQCVVPGLGCGDYVALSYRWGETPDHMRQTANMAKLQEANALQESEIRAHLAPIVRHAMYLTSVLGERYVWIDTLCIDHGDRKAAAEHLNIMGAIYASAIITIIAGDSDSQEGFLGLKGITPPRELEQRIIPFGEEKLIVRNTGIFDLESFAPYHKRGWTYQEYRMSQRRIFFYEKEVHWQCQCSVWHEELILEAQVDKYIDPRLSVMLAGFPDLESLNHGLTTYNERELSYEEDALPGISGLLSVISRGFPGGFLYGIPEMYFDLGLCWRPYWNGSELKRRTPLGRSSITRSSPSVLPSWSWIGWQGLLRSGYNEAARINDRLNYIEETIPITQWYTSSSLNDPPSRRRRIRSTWFENRDSFKDLSRPLPVGWTRHKAPQQSKDEKPHLYPDRCGEYIFSHCNMPDKDCEFWYYPFPVADIQESTPTCISEQTPYLFCDTKRTQLWAVQSGDGNILDLRSESCAKIGLLHLHNEQQRKLFPQITADDPLGKPVEIVAICRSRGYGYSKTWSEEQLYYTYPLWTKEHYRVLWIEEKDGVAYRLASGSVEKDAWEKLDLEDTSLILG